MTIPYWETEKLIQVQATEDVPQHYEHVFMCQGREKVLFRMYQGNSPSLHITEYAYRLLCKDCFCVVKDHGMTKLLEMYPDEKNLK